MKVVENSRRGIVQFIKDPLSIVDGLDSVSDTVTYAITCSIDVKQALARSAMIIDIKLLDEHYLSTIKRSLSDDALSAESMLKLLNDRRADSDRFQAENAIAIVGHTSLDITSIVSNDTKIASDHVTNKASFLSVRTSTLSQASKNTSSIIRSLQARASMDQSILSPDTRDKRINGVRYGIANNVTSGYDPITRAIMHTNVLLDANSQQSEPAVIRDIITTMGSALGSTLPINIIESAVGTDAFSHVTVHVPIRRDVAFGLSTIRVIASLMSSRRKLDEASMLIDVDRVMSIDGMPMIAPTLALSVNVVGIVTVTVGNNDPLSLTVTVFRRKLNVGIDAIRQSQYVKIYDANVPANSSSTFHDTVGVSGHIMYCAVSKHINGTFGQACTYSIAMLGNDAMLGMMSRIKHSGTVSVFAYVVKEGVKVFVHRNALDAIRLSIVRRDITLNESLTTVVATFVGINDQRALIERIDSDVKKGHTYQYSCIVMYADGIERHVGNFANAKFDLIPDDSAISVTLHDQTFDNDMTFAFDLTTRIDDSRMGFIHRLLSAQGLLGYFGDALLSNRESISKLFAHSIVRINHVSGEAVDVGVVGDGRFVDVIANDAMIALKRVGGNIEYVITTYARTATSLLDDAYTVTDSRNKRYVVDRVKYHNPATLRDGTLRARVHTSIRAAAVSGNDRIIDALSFIEGEPVAITTTVFSVGKQNVLIDNLSAIQYNALKNIISWNVIGDRSLIDRFVIGRIYAQNIIVPLHQFHAFNGGTLSFIDDNTDDDIIGYAISTIMVDDSIGSTQTTRLRVS